MENIDNILNNILSMVLWPVAFGLTIIMIIYAGIMFMIADGDPSKITKAKIALVFAVIGFVISVVAFSVPEFIKTILGV